MNKRSITFFITIIVFSLILTVFNYSPIREKAVIELLIFTANLPDSPLKDVLIKHFKKNLSSYLIPALKMINQGEERAGKASEIVFEVIILTYPLPPDILEAMIENIDNEDPKIRLEIINNICESNSIKAYAAILNRAKNDEDLDVRLDAIESLGYFDYPDVKDFLIKQLESESPLIQRRAAYAFVNWIPDNRVFVDDELKRRLINFTYNTRKDDESRIRIMEQFKIFSKEKSVSILLPLLKDANKKIRLAAIGLIGVSGNRDDIKYIVPFLSESDKAIVKEAKNAISNIKYFNPVPTPTP